MRWVGLLRAGARAEEDTVSAGMYKMKGTEGKWRLSTEHFEDDRRFMPVPQSLCLELLR